MLKSFKGSYHLSIQNKLLLALVATIGIAFAISEICAYHYFFNILKERTVYDEEQKLSQTAYQLERIQTEMINVARQIAIDEEIQYILSHYSEYDTFTKIINEENIRRRLASYINIQSHLHSAAIITTDGNIFSSNQTETSFNTEKELWYKQFKSHNMSQGFSTIHSYTIAQGFTSKNVLSYIMTFRDLRKGQEVIGDIIINLDFTKFTKNLIIKDELLKGYALYDRRGNMIVQDKEISLNPEAILQVSDEKLTLDNKNTLLKNTRLQDEWVLVCEISNQLLNQKLQYLKYFFISILVISLGIVWLIIYYFIKRIMKPVQTLYDASMEVGKGNFEVTLDIQTNDEWAILGNAFNSMIDNVQQLIHTSITNEKRIKEMEINRLMLQINPHFIYNTLNSIVYMAKLEGNESIVEFTNAFISLLQDTLSLKKDSLFISMVQELKNIKNYLVLQKYRYPDKFDVIYDYDPEVLQCAVPNVFIQPIVENAIFHGLASQNMRGVLTLSIHREQEQVKIIIADNGIGISKEQIKSLLTNDEAISGKMRTIGIANIRKRIEHIYGQPYGITITSEQEQGTIVTMTIPYQNYEEVGS